MLDSPVLMKSMSIIAILLILLFAKYLYELLNGERKRLAPTKLAIENASKGDQSFVRPNHQSPRVHEVLEQLKLGNIGILQSENYTFEEKATANLHLKEIGLMNLVNDINNSSSDTEVAHVIQKTYLGLQRQSKKELLPLIFSGDMKTKKSPYIKNEPIRKTVEKAYIKLIKDDGLNLQNLKYSYLEETPYSEKLPVGTLSKSPSV